MPRPKKGARLGGSAAHQRLILSNLATALFEHGQIKTTEAKARILRPYAEKLITRARGGELHDIRIAAKDIRNKDVLNILVNEIGPQMAERNGGYTRIIKLPNRKGDNAPMALIQLVTEPVTPKVRSEKKAAPAAEEPIEEATAAEEAAAEEAVEVEADTATDAAAEVEAAEAAAEETADEAK